MAPVLRLLLFTLQLAFVSDAARVTRKRNSSLQEQAGARCTSMRDAETVLGWFRKPQVSTTMPMFNYVLWLDQAGLAGGDGMSSVDPEALAYIEAPARDNYGFDFKVNRCAKRQWSLYGNNISKAGESGLTYQGSEFMRDLGDDRCELEMEIRDEGTIRIGNYFWSTYRIPLVDGTTDCTIDPNKHFADLFQHVQRGLPEAFDLMLKEAVEQKGDWGQLCCPGASSGDPVVWGDVVATCRPPATPECALWHRKNWPALPGMVGYSVYAVGYVSSGAWAPLSPAYGRFEADMKRIGIHTLCFEREA